MGREMNWEAFVKILDDNDVHELRNAIFERIQLQSHEKAVGINITQEQRNLICSQVTEIEAIKAIRDQLPDLSIFDVRELVKIHRR